MSIERPREQDWHVTVSSDDPVKWWRFCTQNSMKPLLIELNTFELQLMCEARFDPRKLIEKHGWVIHREKHEVRFLLPDDPKPCYWECHVKFVGPFSPNLPMSSRDVYRVFRWYLTMRSAVEFDAQAFAAAATAQARGFGSRQVEWEYEACLLDTNSGLDSRWIDSAHMLYQTILDSRKRVLATPTATEELAQMGIKNVRA